MAISLKLYFVDNYFMLNTPEIMVRRNQHGGYFTTGPNKDSAVLIWHHRVIVCHPPDPNSASQWHPERYSPAIAAAVVRPNCTIVLF